MRSNDPRREQHGSVLYATSMKEKDMNKRHSDVKGRDFDVVVLGGGPGGLSFSKNAANFGAKVALIEMNKLGGTCLNLGCVPKKLCYLFSTLAEQLHDLPHYGMDVTLNKIDWATFKTKRDQFISKMNQLYTDGISELKIAYFHGVAKFVDATHVEVLGHVLTARKFVIATGTQPNVPADVQGTENGITSDEFFDMESVPRKCVVIGGGYVAMELVTILNAFNSKVITLVRSDRLLKNFDHMIGDIMKDILQDSNITVMLNTRITQIIEDEKNTKSVLLHNGNMIDGVDCIIWATGRVPRKNLGLDKTGVRTNQLGFIQVDDYQNTSVKNIYALGDVCGRYALTPVAIAAGTKLARRLFGDNPSAKVDYTTIPTVIFTNPPIASVGLSEREAFSEYGRDNIRVYKKEFIPLYYAVMETKPLAHMKLVCLRGGGEKILGLHIIGMHADEVLQGFSVAIKIGLTKKQLDDAISVHPTIAEEILSIK
ncbi:GSR [Cordylochernes scorpioides]|uniref:GSR n=1 Tax=Cordylochernes scorpioides TaxID=51811 RepID=A0ABY6LLF6_9ARAC|nr:GSR [Cordylochernes scorpioides]